MAKKLEEIKVVATEVVTERIDKSAEILAEIVKQNESQAGHNSRDTKTKI